MKSIIKKPNSLEVTAGIEPANRGFADPCLTTWLRDPKKIRFLEYLNSIKKMWVLQENPTFI